VSADLSGAVYLIACGNDPAPTAVPGAGAPPSADTMGFKAWNLLRMADMGLRVPPAFVLGTAFCADADARARAGQCATWAEGLHALEARCGRGLGDPRRPLLLSVRSGAPVSMPGMMETLLNIGLCDATLPGLVRQSGNPRLAWDAYRRLVATHGEVVAGIPGARFEAQVAALTAGRDERTLDFAELRTLTQQHLALYAREAGRPFPQDPAAQLSEAITAVLASWQAPKAVEYRRVNHLPDTLGTAVTVQAMVFGNAGGHSGAGVGFTRDPATGEPHLWVDFLFNAQGEDVVSGRRSAHGHDALASVLPDAWTALQEAAHLLEQHLGDMQDFEFTVQDGQLYMLQTRNGKRTPQAAARIALDLFDEGLITAEVARQRTAGLTPAMLSRTVVVADATDAHGATAQPLQTIGQAATASSGVACGEIAFDEARARARQAAGANVILLRRDAETSDIAALEAAQGLLTARGARTSHAAVVARQMGKVCLVGCATLHIDEAQRCATFDAPNGPDTPGASSASITLREGDVLTLDGNTGRIYPGAVRTVVEAPTDLLARLDRLATA